MGTDTGARARPLRVMTFNIQHGRGVDGHVDLGRTRDVIARAGVDVVGLQEVDRHFGDRSGFIDQARWLADKLGMHVAYGANTDLDLPTPGGTRRQFGNTILSVFPIVDWENIHLPRSGPHEQRGLLRARIDVGGVSWQVHATHLQHDDPAERLVQAQAVSRLLASSNHRVVLLGDLNAQPTTLEVQALTDVLVDAWDAAGVGPGHTSTSSAPNQRIDYVMHSSDVRTTAAAVLTSAPANIASDHLPIVADVAQSGEETSAR
jgi:endonuclease/exonuclease/phosphatase family metal-dependent hydrolase